MYVIHTRIAGASLSEFSAEYAKLSQAKDTRIEKLEGAPSTTLFLPPPIYWANLNIFGTTSRLVTQR